MRYRVDFIDWITGDIAYSATENTSLLDFSFSAKKMASVSYFAIEPMRLKLTFLRDEWLSQALMTPGLELDRSVSKYKIKFYIDDSIAFTGLILLSSIDDDDATEEIQITAYDMIKLFELYSDMAKLYGSTSFSIDSLLSSFCETISSKLGISEIEHDVISPTTNIFTDSTLAYTIDFENISPRVLEIKEQYEGGSDYMQQFFYFRNYYGARVIFLSAITHGKNGAAGKVKGMHFYGRVWNAYNNFCFGQDSSQDVDEYIEADGSSDWEYAVWDKFIAKYPIYDRWASDIGVTTLSIGSKQYSHPYSSGIGYDFLGTTPKEVYYAGPVPSVFRLGSSSMEQLAVLKQAMIIRNMALYCDNSGKLWLKPKTSNGDSININPSDVLSFKRTHISPESLKVDTFNSLKGDTKALATVLTASHHQSIKQTLQGKIEIIGDYTIDLFDSLLLEGTRYRVIEITPDPKNLSHTCTVWRLNA